MPNTPSSPSGQSALTWAQESLGGELTAYLLATDPVHLSQLLEEHAPLSSNQASVAQTFEQLRKSLPSDVDEAGQREMARAWITQINHSGISIARSIREHVGGPDAPADANDEIEEAIGELALDAYPALLLPPDDRISFMGEDINFLYSRLVFEHPKNKAFVEAVLEDSLLGGIFQQTSNAGHMTWVHTNTGSIVGLQLESIPDMVMRTAHRRLSATPRSASMFASETLTELRAVRRSLAGKSKGIASADRPRAVAKVAFAGVRLPEGLQLELGNATLREVSETERRHAPEQLKGQLYGTEGSDREVRFNYDGDVVLEYSFSYRARVAAKESSPYQLPEDMRPPAELEQIVTRLRFSLMLAVQRSARVQIIPTWRRFDEPIYSGTSVSWTDPREGAGIMPTTLSESEVAAWSEWYSRLDNPHVSKIDLALSRVLRALAERREPSDVLIDSVIAWENLFGTKEGEPTFRVTMCLAVLLESTFDARLQLKRRLGRIYGLRSNVVHGNSPLKTSDYPDCQEALDIAIRAIRALTSERTDILALSDGATRSTSLLLGVNVADEGATVESTTADRDPDAGDDLEAA